MTRLALAVALRRSISLLGATPDPKKQKKPPEPSPLDKYLEERVGHLS